MATEYPGVVIHDEDSRYYAIKDLNPGNFFRYSVADEHGVKSEKYYIKCSYPVTNVLSELYVFCFTDNTLYKLKKVFPDTSVEVTKLTFGNITITMPRGNKPDINKDALAVGNLVYINNKNYICSQFDTSPNETDKNKEQTQTSNTTEEEDKEQEKAEELNSKNYILVNIDNGAVEVYNKAYLETPRTNTHILGFRTSDVTVSVR